MLALTKERLQQLIQVEVNKWTPCLGQLASIANCKAHPDENGAIVRIEEDVTEGYGEPAWRCAIIVLDGEPNPVREQLVIRVSAELQPAPWNMIKIEAVYNWLHWDRRGQVALLTNGTISWRQLPENGGNPEFGPSQGFWRRDPELLTIYFARDNIPSNARPRFFVPLDRGCNTSWALRNPHGPHDWCILTRMLLN